MTSYQYQIKDLEMGGQLRRSLKRWRKNGKSYRWIAAKLSEVGVPVGRTVVNNWCRDLTAARTDGKVEECPQTLKPQAVTDTA